jgi:hypothetical protein
MKRFWVYKQIFITIKHVDELQGPGTKNSISKCKENSVKETYLFIVNLNPTIIISIKLSERVSQGLYGDASLNKVIKSNISLSCVFNSSYKLILIKLLKPFKINKPTITIEFLNQSKDKLGCYIEAKRSQRVTHLSLVNTARTISIKGLETSLPIFNVLP